jgi:pimeloyl-ACP methyl ester carboxylesterase
MLYFPSASAEQLKAAAELQRMAMSGDAAVQLRLACADIDVVDLLPRVTAPTLILHSRHDNAVPLEEGRRLASGIPHATAIRDRAALIARRSRRRPAPCGGAVERSSTNRADAAR